MDFSRFLQTVETLHAEARARGLFFQHIEDDEIHGREITINGQRMLWFGSCSYLGLSQREELIEAACEATRRYGAQFASSRGYVSVQLHQALETMLSEIFGGYALIGQTTTLAHMAAFDVLATEKDAVVLDHQVHASVHGAAVHARAHGAAVETVNHERLDEALSVVERLSRRHRTVIFACDGVTSMYGDLAPYPLLQQILDVAPNVRLYIDDAHGTSWAGVHGRGRFLTRFPMSDRLVLATSLAKSFSAGGGALVFSTHEERERVRMCGGTMVFSGPLQPPLLGAAVASAQIHLSPEIRQLQHRLHTNVQRVNRGLLQIDAPLLVVNDTPIFFIALQRPRLAFALAERLAADGIYTNVSIYPSVPMRRAGLRLTTIARHTEEDIDRMLSVMQDRMSQLFREEGISAEQLREEVSGAVVGTDARARLSRPRTGRRPSGYTVEHFETIDRIDPALWDGMLGGGACISHASLKMQESVFSETTTPEHNWGFHYTLVRDQGGRVVAATVLTDTVIKEDQLSRSEVSERLEALRRDDPYLLTSRTLMMGTGLSEGSHLYLDRSGPWRPALAALLDAVIRRWQDGPYNTLLLRDFPSTDRELRAFLIEEGLVPVPMPDSHILSPDWSDGEGFLSQFSRKKRRLLRRMLERLDEMTVRVFGARPGLIRPTEQDLAGWHEMYQEVARRNLDLNMFHLPRTLLPQLAACPSWELVALYRKEAAPGDRPVAWFGAHIHQTHYAPLLCGLDYRYVRTEGVYRKMMLQIALRGAQVGAETIHLGMAADREKLRIGSIPRKAEAYIMIKDDFPASQLTEIAMELGLESAHRAQD